MIELGKKYGCLTILDLGEEYKNTEKYKELIEEYNENVKLHNSLLNKIKEKQDKRSIEMREMKDVEQKITTIEKMLQPHYKCKCKCGKIYFYNEQTLERKPQYCFYPVPISTKHSYSTKASDATYRKEKRYEKIENVILRDKNECVPNERFCKYYNAYKEKQITEKERKILEEIAQIPRVYAEKYEENFVGMQYETLKVLECTNERLESKPWIYRSTTGRKHWANITVYKQYRCVCDLCGKEHFVKCDEFGIYPPTDCGPQTYYGYWSKVSCDCHKISSFQWIVNKILIENKINYKAEYSFENSFGIGEKNLLKYDFAILKEDGSVKCLIECQGEQHFKPIEEFGGEQQFAIQIQNDELKRIYAKNNSIPLLEISYKDKKYEKIKDMLRRNNII